MTIKEIDMKRFAEALACDERGKRRLKLIGHKASFVRKSKNDKDYSKLTLATKNLLEVL